MVRGMRRTIDERAFLFSSTVHGDGGDLHLAAPRPDDQLRVEDVLPHDRLGRVLLDHLAAQGLHAVRVVHPAVEKDAQDGGEPVGDQVADGRALVLRPLHELAAHHDAGVLGQQVAGREHEGHVVKVDVEVDDEVAPAGEHAGLHGVAVVRDGDAQRLDAGVLGREPLGDGRRGVGAAVLGEDELVVDALGVHLRDELRDLGLEALGLVVDGDDHRIARARRAGSGMFFLLHG